MGGLCAYHSRHLRIACLFGEHIGCLAVIKLCKDICTLLAQEAHQFYVPMLCRKV